MDSWPRPGAIAYQADKNILQRALVRIQVLVADTELAHAPQQRRDAGSLCIRIEAVAQLRALSSKLQLPIPQARGNRAHVLLQLQRQLLPAELFHQRELVLDQDKFALA